MQCKDSEIFNSQKNNLHKDYVDQLNVTMKEYPSFKMEKETKYSEELSKLNGITKKLTDLETSVTTKTNELERSIEQKDVDIEKLKKIEEIYQYYLINFIIRSMFYGSSVSLVEEQSVVLSFR